jgi:hypothetical protein
MAIGGVGLILVGLAAVVGLLLVVFGGYALYEGFSDAPSRLMASKSVAKMVGVVAVLLGLLMACAPLAFFMASFAVIP